MKKYPMPIITARLWAGSERNDAMPNPRQSNVSGMKLVWEMGYSSVLEKIGAVSEKVVQRETSVSEVVRYTHQ